jgi:hypothetical protein
LERVHVLRGFLILSIRVNSRDSRAEKSSQAATIFACSSTGMPIFAQRVAFGNSGRTGASPPKDGFAVANLEFAGRPVGNALPDGIAMSQQVPVIVREDHCAPAPGLAQLQRGRS